MEHDAPETRPDVPSPALLHGVVTTVLLVSTACVLAVVVIGLVLNGRLEAGVDSRIILLLQSLRGTAFEPLMVAVSFPGNAPVFVPLVLAVTVGVWLWRSREEAIFLAGSLAFAMGIAWMVSELVARVRPGGGLFWAYETLLSYSYPSRHVVTYVVFFGLLCYLALTRWKGSRLSWPIAVVSALMVILVGPSRVFLGAHWPSDVLAGYAVGGTVLAASIHLYSNWGRAAAAGKKR